MTLICGSECCDALSLTGLCQESLKMNISMRIDANNDEKRLGHVIPIPLPSLYK